ncbi:hypothetical protein [Chitinophaga barathri]|uniref:Uncharacterized protein n=1 Tax=Chitinophaga barathri TaxID=1647451 RepID=A0A3N4MFS3_9BACT|nr:hypothetical protein [Chitinophaga barathri]RPD38499.1 hypothetical protein EG028_24845 [Chitinophaga barathri]
MTQTNFEEKIASYVLGYLTEKDLPDIAITALTNGRDSDSLLILAGMSSSDNGFELRAYFASALAENNLVLPDKKEALEFYITSIIKRINSLSQSPYDGFCEIYNAVDGSVYSFQELGLWDCYCYHLEIWEIETGGTEYYPKDFSREKFIAEMEERLLEALNLWDKNHSN